MPGSRRGCVSRQADQAARLLEELQVLCGGKGHDIPEAAATDAPRLLGAQRREGPVPIVNADTLADLEELGSSATFMDKLVGVFVADNVTLLAKMEASLAARNVGEFRSHLHAMKGSAASMGAERLTGYCKDVGRYSDSEVKLRIPALLNSLREELAVIRDAFERYLQARKKSTG